MQILAFKVLFRKRGTVSAILAVALLVAILASTTALLNNINAQTALLTSLPSTGQSFLVTSAGSPSLEDSQVDLELINQIRNTSGVSYATAQQILHVTIRVESGDYPVTVRGVDDVAAFLKNRHASISGKVSQGDLQANVGIILSNMASISRNDELVLIFNNQQIQLNVTGITRSNDQSDSELIMPLASFEKITPNLSGGSFVEFSVGDSSRASKVVNDLVAKLPSDVKVVGTQQMVAFAQDINNQTVNFISVWSVSVYVVVMGASYVIALRVLNDAKYELFMLRIFGTKKGGLAALITLYTLALAFVGAVIGVAIGVVGTQVISTGIRWFLGNSFLSPFLEPLQALQILLLAVFFSVTGAIYPAVRATKNLVEEAPI